MQVNAFIWQNGADIWDETKAPEGQAEGVVNSPEAVKALDHYLSLPEYMPPVVKTGTMDIFKIDELFREGKVAWNIEWIGFAESAINPEDLEGRRQGRLRACIRACAGPTASSTAGPTSAASRSC